MSEPIEVVDGQALARRILEALDGGQAPDWASLDRAYSEVLLRAAADRVRRLERLSRFSPEDVLHDFLLCRVYPPAQARGMFAASAKGDRPLRPRLLASLGNHCFDLARAPEIRLVQGHEGRLAMVPAPAKDQLPAYEEVENLLRRQMAAIRNACPARRRPNGAAYLEAILLRLRLEWAGGFDGVELRSSSGQAVVLTLQRLEELTAWTDDERAMPLTEGGIPLEQLWQQARAILLSTPAREVHVEQLAPLVPVSRDLWSQWVSRARRMVRTRLGAEYAEVFPVWASQREGP